MVAGSTARFHAILGAMTRWLMIACAVVLATCVSIPPYVAPLAVGWDDANHLMTGSNFSLHIGTRFSFPDALVLGGTNLLAHGSGATCNNEDGAGVALYPAPRVSASSAIASDGDQVD